MRTALKIFGLFLLMVVVIVATFAGGFVASRTLFPAKVTETNDGAPTSFQDSMPVFWEAWNIIQSEFYQKSLDTTKMTYGAIAGMVDALGDPHTQFVDPKQAAIINSDLAGTFEGIGATVNMQSGRLVIAAPIKNSPAANAGLKPGDVILKVNDTVIQNMTVDEAVALIRGPKGTTVKLTVQRQGQPAFEVSIVRDTIQSPVVESKMLNNNIAYLKLNEFTATAPDVLHKELQSLLDQHPKALILDLRNNPGGFLSAAVDIASEFLKQDQVVLIERAKTGAEQKYAAKGGGIATDIPLVVLVNENSASASEILSGAIKDYKRAEIIGVTTYGKGSVQTPDQLSDGSQLRVTIAHFFSPLNHEINGVGIVPDIKVDDPTDAQFLQNQDPQLDRAVQFINSGGQPQSSSWVFPFQLPQIPALPF